MATNWEITGQRQIDELNDGGAFEAVMEINYRTIPEAIQGQIKVPFRLYSPDYVRAEIDRRVGIIKDVQSL